MKKLLLIAGIVSLVTCGCRVVENHNIVTNYGNNNGIESLNEGTQAADKDYSDLLNGTEAAVGPLSRTGGSTGDNGTPAE